MEYTVHTDGGAIGFVIRDGSGKVLRKVGKRIGEATNNVAEYEALIVALGELKKLVPKGERKNAHVSVRMDSELVVKQLSGEYQIKEEPLQLLFVTVWNLRVSEFPNVTFTHIAREENAEADALVNNALDAEQGTLLS